MVAVLVSDTVQYGDMARYAYQEVLGKYDLKKALIPDTPSDTVRYILRPIRTNNTSLERAPRAHQRWPILVELIV